MRFPVKVPNIYPLNLNFLLSKALNYGLPIGEKEKSNVFALRDIITNHEVEQNELTQRIIETSTADIDTSTWEQESVARAREAINRLYTRAQNNPNLSDWQKEILAKADQLNLSYNRSDMNWFMLSDIIEELEFLMPVAESYGIFDWDANDLVHLKQQIEDAEHAGAKERIATRNEYLASVL